MSSEISEKIWPPSYVRRTLRHREAIFRSQVSEDCWENLDVKIDWIMWFICRKYTRKVTPASPTLLCITLRFTPTNGRRSSFSFAMCFLVFVYVNLCDTKLSVFWEEEQISEDGEIFPREFVPGWTYLFGGTYFLWHWGNFALWKGKSLKKKCSSKPLERINYVIFQKPGR